MTKGLLSGMARYFISAVLLSGSAVAQERTGSVYLHGGVTRPYQDGLSGETEHQTYVAAPGGSTAGWRLGAGVFIASRLSLEGETASTGVMAARQPSRYGMTFNEERRERFFSVNLRGHLGGSRGIHLEPVVGLTLMRGTTWSQTEYERLGASGLTRVEVGPRIESTLPGGAAVSFGLDARIGGRRFALVPSLRAAFARRPDAFAESYPGGFPRWTISPGIMGRVDF